MTQCSVSLFATLHHTIRPTAQTAPIFQNRASLYGVLVSTPKIGHSALGCLGASGCAPALED